jgi:hypothetical protein
MQSQLPVNLQVVHLGSQLIISLIYKLQEAFLHNHQSRQDSFWEEGEARKFVNELKWDFRYTSG